MIETNLISCPCCEEGACLETKTEYVTLWSCQTCGYQSNSRMKPNSEFVERHHFSLPNLMQDLRKEKNDLIWYPSVVNLDKQGMVFPDGSNKEDWKWTAILAVEVSEEEKEKFKNATHRLDNFTSKSFDRLCYMDALEYIGFYKP